MSLVVNTNVQALIANIALSFNTDQLNKSVEKLSTGYSGYFNKLHERVGSLFQRTYKAEHLDTDEYLKYMFAYVHLNPIKLIQRDWKESGIKNLQKAKQFLSTYHYSSYFDYKDIGREENLILSKDIFPEYEI